MREHKALKCRHACVPVAWRIVRVGPGPTTAGAFFLRRANVPHMGLARGLEDAGGRILMHKSLNRKKQVMYYSARAARQPAAPHGALAVESVVFEVKNGPRRPVCCFFS
ncbi:hypothetical protein PUN4_130179 [Paraburkholderia unamae]|nr:hypothetical protein PUN4_130179 [Paraburkholderia unamae]